MPGQKEHVEALVLAFSHSRASRLVGTDALRTVISGQYRELVSGGVLHLEGVWSLLESQPGFEADLVKPPLCRYKLWESDLGIQVQLPAALADLDSLAVRACADKCRVSEAELDKILGRGRYTPAQRAERAARLADTDAKISEPTSKEPRVSRPIVLWVAIVVAVASFAVTGFFLYQAFTQTPPDAIAVSFAPDIPLAKAERAGLDVGAILANESWLEQPQEQRRGHLMSAMTNLQRDGVKTLYIRDKKGKVRALAQSYDKGSKVRIQFF